MFISVRLRVPERTLPPCADTPAPLASHLLLECLPDKMKPIVPKISSSCSSEAICSYCFLVILCLCPSARVAPVQLLMTSLQMITHWSVKTFLVFFGLPACVDPRLRTAMDTFRVYDSRLYHLSVLPSDISGCLY